MSDVVNLSAERRERAGKGAARAVRRTGRVPAVIYGNKQDAVMISLDPIELRKQIRGQAFFSRVYEIQVDGEKHRVLARDLQQDPVSDAPIHVDFMRFDADTRVNVEITVVFDNEETCPGIKQGGVLNVVRHTIELNCRPDGIPEAIHTDLSELDLGGAIHSSDVTLPPDTEMVISDRDFTIATIAAPAAEMPEEEEGEEAEVEEGEAAEAEEGGGEEE